MAITRSKSCRGIACDGAPRQHLLALAIGLSLCVPLSADAGEYALSTLDTLGGEAGWANAIGDSGHIVGRGYAGGAPRAVLWTGPKAAPQDLGTFGGAWSDATAVNSSGQVVGYASQAISGQSFTGLTWIDGVASALPGASAQSTGSLATGINAAGQIAGSISGRQFFDRAVSWNNGAASLLKRLGPIATPSQAVAINVDGTIVGHFESNRAGTVHAAKWSGGGGVDLGTLDGAESWATAVNASGQVGGFGTLLQAPGYRAIVWRDNTPTNLGTLGMPNSFAHAINDAGTVVGAACMTQSDDSCRATRWDASGGVDLNSFLCADDVAAGWLLQVARGINNQGWIVGTAYNQLTLRTVPFVLSRP